MASKNDLGLIHLYHGDGKGKTTACFGLALRALGCGYKVLIAQFLKSGKSSELKMITDFEGATLILGKPMGKFTFQMNQEELMQCKEQNSLYLKEIKAKAEELGVDMLIMDEAVNAVSTNTLSESELISFLKEKNANLEVVLSGRNPSEKIKELCDYVSQIKKEKHPFDKGINAREGIEM